MHEYFDLFGVLIKNVVSNLTRKAQKAWNLDSKYLSLDTPVLSRVELECQ